MNRDKNIEIAKRIITEEAQAAGYKVDRIILFGSRAKGNYKEDSDYDFFVILDKNLSKEDWKLILRNIYRKFADNYINADVIIKSKLLYKRQQNGTGFLAYYVNKEGISL